ncbi:hypothetical protein [Chitinophaga sp.]|uniref:hypothetical protein n=1 Tax=Chitinophaga sp. TaxID=1869181 RepID=UPI00260BEE11|nr:hypothetical protein [uncultured Chitinophaga sp.]
MKKIVFTGLLACISYICNAQNVLIARILEADSNEPLSGATVALPGTSLGMPLHSVSSVLKRLSTRWSSRAVPTP